MRDGFVRSNRSFVSGAWQASAALSLSGMCAYAKAARALDQRTPGRLDAGDTHADTHIEGIPQCASAGMPAAIHSIMPSSSGSPLLLAAAIRDRF